MSSIDDNKPGLAFRIGITGAVSIDSEQVQRVSNEIRDILTTVGKHIDIIADSLLARSVYSARRPRLRMVSSLAEGSDRIAAKEAVAQGYTLEVILPFAANDYEATFGKMTPLSLEDSVREFRDLLGQAGSACLTLDGGVEDGIRGQSYEAAGRNVVRNCDLLIAVWDDKRIPKGIGGTNDTLRYALGAGVPVWWINPHSVTEPQWLESIIDLPGEHEGAPLKGEGAVEALKAYLTRTLTPPGKLKTSGIFRKRLKVRADFLSRYLRQEVKPNRNYWALHQVWLEALHWAGRVIEAGEQRGPTGVVDLPKSRRRNLLGVLLWPFAFSEIRASSSRASQLASIFQQRYRTSYLMVFAMGAVALSSAVIGLAHPSFEHYCLGVELGALLVVLALVFVNWVWKWQDKYISYRILGELFRASSIMAKLGWELPGYRAGNLANSTKRAWVGWLFAATVRDGVFRSGTLGLDELCPIRSYLEADFLALQIKFHQNRARSNAGASKLLAWGSLFLFCVAIILALARVVFVVSGASDEVLLPFSIASAIVPAFSAAFFGIRAYEDLEMLAQQSAHMAEALGDASARISKLNLASPLASQILAGKCAEIATLMLTDVEGWAQLYRLKGVEA